MQRRQLGAGGVCPQLRVVAHVTCGGTNVPAEAGRRIMISTKHDLSWVSLGFSKIIASRTMTQRLGFFRVDDDWAVTLRCGGDTDVALGALLISKLEWGLGFSWISLVPPKANMGPPCPTPLSSGGCDPRGSISKCRANGRPSGPCFGVFVSQ